jgi:hypothetical protein
MKMPKKSEMTLLLLLPLYLVLCPFSPKVQKMMYEMKKKPEKNSFSLSTPPIYLISLDSVIDPTSSPRILGIPVPA